MKVLFPKHIKKGLLSGMTFQIGPLSIGILQLFILAAGIAVALALFNAAGKESRAVGLLVAVPVFIIFIIVAFFKISEMGLVQFIAKLARTKLFDTTRKFQVNFEKPDKTRIIIAEAKSEEEKKKIEPKVQKSIDPQILKSIQDSDLL